ncbi:hypothetical protein ACFV2U_12265 [Streptomyces sp. NPDC059697]|uniref:hypothetical protein n=1 Tax=Streptomyces sp. NPDC059697 TaxID=3346912 RepID=UPI00367B478B
MRDRSTYEVPPTVQAKDDEPFEPAQAVRAQDVDLRTVAQRVESWQILLVLTNTEVAR